MHIRKLQEKDSELMFEWMSDNDVTQWLHGDYQNAIIEDATSFIESTENIIDELHFAIANDEDEYMGTVSLRHIDNSNGIAEFAIVVRKAAMTKGYAWQGMLQVLDFAFKSLDLECVYWRVSQDNKRALRFFEKHGFTQLDEDIPPEIQFRHSNEHGLVWFSVIKGDDYKNEALLRGHIADCKIVNIKTIPTIGAGELSFFESNNDIMFDIKRIYYISKVPEGIRRGFHAHKSLKQLLFCPYGKIQLLLDNGSKREEITLSDPSIGILIDKPTWREMLWLQKDSVLVVAASDYYDVEDYIRNYDDFITYITTLNSNK